MRNECNIIRDILPLYIEGIASEDTVDFVEEHLEKCEECRLELENMKNPNELEKYTTNIQNNDVVSLKTLKKKWKCQQIALICLTSFITMIMCIVVAYNYRGMLCGIEHGGYSAPASVAFLYAIPFIIVILVCAIFAYVFYKKSK